jgi:hypothetical protein
LSRGLLRRSSSVQVRGDQMAIRERRVKSNQSKANRIWGEAACLGRVW